MNLYIALIIIWGLWAGFFYFLLLREKPQIHPSAEKPKELDILEGIETEEQPFEYLKSKGYCLCGGAYNEYWPSHKKPKWSGHIDDVLGVEEWCKSQKLMCSKCHNVLTVGEYELIQK